MRQPRKPRIGFALLAVPLVWLGIMGPTPAQAQTGPSANLATLVANFGTPAGTLTIPEPGGGSLIFSNFSESPNVPAATTFVTTLLSGANGDGPGIFFTGPFVNNTSTAVDFHLDYTVTATGAPITDLSLSANPALFTAGVGSALITEAISPPVLGPPGQLSLTLINGMLSTIPANGVNVLGTPERTLALSKDMILTNAFASEITQGFSFGPTAVPEPSSIAMLGLGTLGVFGLGWRHRRRAAHA